MRIDDEPAAFGFLTRLGLVDIDRLDSVLSVTEKLLGFPTAFRLRVAVDTAEW